jgi:hypothetical protein
VVLAESIREIEHSMKDKRAAGMNRRSVSHIALHFVGSNEKFMGEGVKVYGDRKKMADMLNY